MTTLWETPEDHDLYAGQPVAAPRDLALALPLPTTPGYTFFTDYKGNRWTCCTCVRDFLVYAQQLAIKRGLLKQGFDIWQLTGGATASGGTHSLGGAFDLLFQTTDGWVKFFRDLGATASWRRTVQQGFSAVHLHGVLNGCVHNTPAAYQVVAQRDKYNGLGYMGRGGPDYHPAPVPYLTWGQGVTVMKKELGLLALPSTTTLVVSPTTVSKGAFALLVSRTTQPGPKYVSGWHAYEYQPPGTTSWVEFKRTSTQNGVTQIYWSFGSSHLVRTRYIPFDGTVTAPSQSPSVMVTNVDVKPLVAENIALKAQVADLQAQLAAQGPQVP